MNTTAAAVQAGVTVPTIRTWCRSGAVAATKTAGRRRVIDAASLARRIAIGAMRAARRTTVDDTPDYAALAAEARALAASLTPPPGCHPADREGGQRDRASGKHRARGAARRAAMGFEDAAAQAAEQPATERTRWLAAELRLHAMASLESARRRAANLRSIG
ncbi:hypothetical protein AB0D49_08350 [Streptomyces sp. NPDC048290]|uniref:hypothetical protein n=1 Tax=Streptomyces sp. NPDC048290 TaxID=3155811 RepID=UPI00341B4B86